MMIEAYAVHVPVVVNGRNAVEIGRAFRIELDATESAAVLRRSRELGSVPSELIEGFVRGLLRG
jgi:hypothetical protein